MATPAINPAVSPSPISAPLVSREVVHCPNPLCDLHTRPQFVLPDCKCRRCHTNIDGKVNDLVPAPIVVTVPVEGVFVPDHCASDPMFWLPFLLMWLRERGGWTQRQFGKRFTPPKNRTYISKMEIGASIPNMMTLVDYADKLGVGIGAVLRLCEWMAQGCPLD